MPSLNKNIIDDLIAGAYPDAIDKRSVGLVNGSNPDHARNSRDNDTKG